MLAIIILLKIANIIPISYSNAIRSQKQTDICKKILLGNPIDEDDFKRNIYPDIKTGKKYIHLLRKYKFNIFHNN